MMDGSVTKAATELELEHLFWDAMSTNVEFQSWLLERTRTWFLKQTRVDTMALDLVLNERWHQRWHTDRHGNESESDILLIFRNRENSQRYAIHIENKPLHGTWQPGEAEGYRLRAEHCMAKWRYVDFQTVLLAPAQFIERYPEEGPMLGRGDFV